MGRAGPLQGCESLGPAQPRYPGGLGRGRGLELRGPEGGEAARRRSGVLAVKPRGAWTPATWAPPRPEMPRVA